MTVTPSGLAYISEKSRFSIFIKIFWKNGCFSGIERIPIFPEQAVNFEGKSSERTLINGRKV
jgi:hypothetical protein